MDEVTAFFRRIQRRALRDLERMVGTPLSADVRAHLEAGQASIRAEAGERAAARDWLGFLGLVGSEERLALAHVTWPMLREDEWCEFLADAVSSGDLPSRERAWLRRVLRGLRGVFDGPEAEAAFDLLPDVVRLYRGTVEREWTCGEPLGVCWTTDRSTAVFFATEHGRFRNTASPPVILEVELPKTAISGYLAGRDESEALAVVNRNMGVTYELRAPPQ